MSTLNPKFKSFSPSYKTYKTYKTSHTKHVFKSFSPSKTYTLPIHRRINTSVLSLDNGHNSFYGYNCNIFYIYYYFNFWREKPSEYHHFYWIVKRDEE